MNTNYYYIFVKDERGKISYTKLSKDIDINDFCKKLCYKYPFIEVHNPNDWNDIECFFMFIERTYGLLCELNQIVL